MDILIKNQILHHYPEILFQLPHALHKFLRIKSLDQEYLMYIIPLSTNEAGVAFHVSRKRITSPKDLEASIEDFFNYPYLEEEEIISFETNSLVMNSLKHLDHVLNGMLEQRKYYNFALIPRFDPLEREPIYVINASKNLWRKCISAQEHITVQEFYLWNMAFRFSPN